MIKNKELIRLKDLNININKNNKIIEPLIVYKLLRYILIIIKREKIKL